MLDTEGLWETYHYIRKLAELGSDERGNCWDQLTYGSPVILGYSESFKFKEPQFVCNTRMCFAGWYAYLKGMKLNSLGKLRTGNIAVNVPHWVSDRAGLNVLQAARLFRGDNDLTALRKVLTDITGVDHG